MGYVRYDSPERTAAVIAYQCDDRYDRDEQTKAVKMAAPDPDEVERRLGAGEWLKPGEVAALFNTTRFSVDRWLRNGARMGGQRHRIGYRETPGGHRECDPADIQRLLALYRQRRTASDDPAG